MFKETQIFTVVDDTTIGDSMAADPPADTPRIVPAEEAAKIAATLPKRPCT